MKKVRTGRRILNVGCGNDNYGTDRVDIVKSKATTKVANIEKSLPYKDNSFDEVYCSYVWEHMKNPFNLLLEMKRVCKWGGRIVVLTDNAGYVYTHMKFRGYHGNYSDKAVHQGEFNKMDRHYALYTPEHLRNFFEAVGLTIQEVKLVYWEKVKSNKSRFVHFITKLFLGERFAMPSVRIVGLKSRKVF